MASNWSVLLLGQHQTESPEQKQHQKETSLVSLLQPSLCFFVFLLHHLTNYSFSDSNVTVCFLQCDSVSFTGSCSLLQLVGWCRTGVTANGFLAADLNVKKKKIQLLSH